MLCVFMMGVTMTNASNERIKKLEQDEEMNVSSERQICKQQKKPTFTLQIRGYVHPSAKKK